MKLFLIKITRFHIGIRIQFFLILMVFTSCQKLIEVDPPINGIVAEDMYKFDATAASVLTGIYASMSSNGIFNGTRGISLRAGLSADELESTAVPSDVLTAIYLNTLSNNGDQLFWGNLYEYIFKINSAIEGINASKSITPSVSKQLIGESKFLRAFMYFYLVNFYGDVPLLTSTDIKINSIAARISKDKIYEQIVTDLSEAVEDLDVNYLSSDIKTVTTERIRPNKAVAQALLARVYLYMKKWDFAEQESTRILENISVYKMEDLNDVFLKQSKEAIFQLQPVAFDHNTEDAMAFVLADNGATAGPNSDTRPVYLSRDLYNSFENGDKRKNTWIDSVTVSNITYPYAYKYKVWLSGQPVSEYLMVLRLAEQYLIRAEARAQLGRLEGPNSAASDLNVIRTRAGLRKLLPVSKEEMLKFILQERRKELFTEWGHRWFDLKRTGVIDDVMAKASQMKGSTWASYKSLYPIPVQDIQRNPSLKGHQNPGYPEL